MDDDEDNDEPSMYDDEEGTNEASASPGYDLRLVERIESAT